MSKMFRFECGCSIPIDESLPEIHGQPSLIYPSDVNELPWDCPLVWDMLAEGCTKGVFQLESPLGRQYVKKLKPGIPDSKMGMEHLAALGAALRPGCLRVKDAEGISMTDMYCLRKNGERPVEFFHPSLEPILGTTYGVLLFQEQSMDISKRLYGYSDMEADNLRKAMGKKDTELMSKLKAQSAEKAAAHGVVNAEQAAEIFGWIEKSQRYNFNKSHAFSYAMIGYHTAHLKAHFPLEFYTSFLYFAKEKQDPLLEIRQLVNDAKTMGIEVVPPSLDRCKHHFTFNPDRVSISFGIADVKKLGSPAVNKARQVIRNAEKNMAVPCVNWDWMTFLTGVAPALPSLLVKQLISVGGMGKYKMDRQRMLFEYECYSELTEKEQAKIYELVRFESMTGDLFDRPQKVKNITEALEALLNIPKGTHNKDRRDKVDSLLKLLKKPPRDLKDTPYWIAKTEKENLGIPLTCSKMEGIPDLQADTTCKEFQDGKDGGDMVLAVEIQECKEHRCQTGKSIGRTMAWLTIGDQTGSMEDVCVFPDAFAKFENLLFVGNTVELKGRRDPKRGQFVVDEVLRL